MAWGRFAAQSGCTVIVVDYLYLYAISVVLKQWWWSPTEPSLMSVKDDTSNPATLDPHCHTSNPATIHTGPCLLRNAVLYSCNCITHTIFDIFHMILNNFEENYFTLLIKLRFWFSLHCNEVTINIFGKNLYLYLYLYLHLYLYLYYCSRVKQSPLWAIIRFFVGRHNQLHCTLVHWD